MGQKLFSKCHSEFLIDVIRLEFAKLFNWIQMNMVFKSSRPTKFYKIGFLEKIRRIHMETTEIYNSNKKRLQCWCFPVNLAKVLRTFCHRTRQGSASGFFHSPNYFLLIEIRFLDLRCFHENSASFLRN